MASRRDVERALSWSNLRPLARLVVLALLTKADWDTCIIPAEFTPSLVTISAMTGLAKSQVAKELGYLETLGWVKRSKPAKSSRYERTSYALAVGASDPDRPSSPQHGQDESAVRGADYSPPADTGSAVRGADRIGDDEAASGVRHADGSFRGTTKVDDESAGEQRSAARTAEASSPQHGHATNTTKQKPSTQKKGRPKVRDIPRPDVDALCEHLAAWMVKNGCKPPTISQEWRDEARRMLDLDKREFDKAMALIDWCQKSAFWRPNIQSMPTFREKYDTLRLQATAEWRRDRAGPNGRSGGLSDAAAAAAYARAQAREAAAS